SDLAVQRVSALTPTGVLAIVQIYELQQRLNLTFEEAIALHSNIPNEIIYKRQVYNEFLNLSVEEAVPGMLDRLFDQDKIKIEVAPVTSTDTNGLTIPNMRVDHLTANGQLPYLLKGLGVSQADYERLIGLLFGTTGPILNLKNVSDCYRFVRVAKALGLSVEELGYLLQLDNNSLALDPARILRIIPLVDKVKTMPVSLHEMWFVSHNDTDNAGNSKIQSGYNGVNANNIPLANVAAEQWTKDFFANKALYISKETLKTFLPATFRETRVNDFIVALHTAGIVLLADVELGCRVLRRSTHYVLADIPAQFPNIDPVTNQPIADPAEIVLETTAREALAKFLNENYLFDQDSTTSMQERLIREQLGALLKIDFGLIENLDDWSQTLPGALTEMESNWLISTGFQYTNLQTALPALERIAFVWNKLGFDKADVQWIKTHSGQFLSGTGNNGLLSRLDTLDEFVRLSDYMRYKKQAGDDSGASAYRNALAQNKTTWFGVQSETIARLLGCEVGQLKAVGNLLKIDFTDPNSNLIIQTYDLPASTTQALAKLEAILSVCKRLGIYQTDMLLALKECDYTNAGQYEKALRDALRARYASEDEFEKAWEPYENRINELRRDVLCAFLLAMKDLSNFENTGDLYAYFLVDVEMSGCARVSEVLAATLSLQTYVHRVIMGLEASVAHTVQGIFHPAVRAYLGHPTFTANNVKNYDNQAEKRAQWEWRKNYRIWEANRKVFLYPENWIEPELRDNKSPLFRTLEDELLQQKISLESAEGAYKEYLKGYAEVGNLVIAGVYYEEKAERPVYHIFGRTATDPYQYYYRQFTPSKQFWSPWQKIELSISAPYLSAIKHNEKVYIFWMDVTSMKEEWLINGNSDFQWFSNDLYLNYSYLTENGKWIQSQKTLYSVWRNYENSQYDASKNKKAYEESYQVYMENTKYFRRVFPFKRDGKLYLNYMFDHFYKGLRYTTSGQRHLDLYRNKLNGSSINQHPNTPGVLTLVKHNNNVTFGIAQANSPHEANIDILMNENHSYGQV
ncbi:MAG: hypothetical protein JNJ57_13640, partial [Saprospiraceae bacterium]|nr:hypothetical protein [Saprospiraceae bacterium]